MKKQPDKVPKLLKGVNQEFLDNIQSMSTDQLKAQIVSLQVSGQENEAFKESEEFIGAQDEFDQAKDRYDLVAGPVKETAVSIKNRTKCVVKRLQDKGGA